MKRGGCGRNGWKEYLRNSNDGVEIKGVGIRVIAIVGLFTLY